MKKRSSIEIPLIAVHNSQALKEVWQYYFQEDNLPTGCQELLKFLGLLFVSGGSALYGAIAKKATEGDPPWEQQSFVICTSLCAGIVLINSTNEYLLKRDARRLPEALRALSQSASQCQYFLEDTAITIVSAIASLSLATTAWNYPDLPNKTLQVIWVLYIETVNTVLHLWPVDVFAFGHPIYSLPLRPFQWVYRQIEKCFLPAEEQEAREFFKFKRKIADDLCNKLIATLDQVSTQIIDESFEWKGFSSSVRQWFSYVKKPSSPINTVFSKELEDVLVQPDQPPITEQKPSVSWKNWIGEKLQQVSYAVGATLVTSSCMGYLVDPPYTLQELGLSETLAITVSTPAMYFLGVLLAHTGGVSLQADVSRVGRVLQCKESIPLSAKLHTKSFGLVMLLNIYIAAFSYGGSVQTVRDHFADSPLEGFLLWCAQYGLIYLSLSSVNNFYQYYSTKFVRLYANDENYLVAQFQERKEALKRHLTAIDPDHLVASLMTYSDEQLRHILGMTKAQLIVMTDFKNRFEEYQLRSKKPINRWLCEDLCSFFKRNRSAEEELTLPINQAPSA